MLSKLLFYLFYKKIIVMYKHTTTALTTILILLSQFLAFTQKTYNIDNGHSNIGFAIQWNDYGFRTGEFKAFGGTIVTKNPKDFNQASANLKIMVGSIDVIVDHLGKKLLQPEFLDSAKCPMITFDCSSLKKKKKNLYLAEGTLTAKCISQPVVFLVEVLGTKEKYAALKVTGELDKSKFGITGGGDRLGNKILITSYFELKEKNQE